MKARSLRQSMAWIHGWLGLLAGWILFAMFLTGTASYFRPEITRWMRPELNLAEVPPARSAAAAVRHMQRVEANATQWFISLPDERTAITRVFVQRRPDPGAPRARSPEIELEPASGEPARARETRGGEHFYRFHFQLQLPHPWGRWLAGLCAMFMLGAIVSGVITHKRILADFFTLRWRKGRRSWLDAHNASAVLALPFHAMITYTGLITLVAMYMPWPAVANFRDPAEFGRAALGMPREVEASGVHAPLAPVMPMVRDAERRWNAPAARLVVRHPNDRAATVTVYRHTGASLNARGPSVIYSGADGRVLATSPELRPALATAGVMLGLHVAHYAGIALRWTLFLLGLTGAAMVGTGLLLWTAARRRPNARPFPGLRIVERLNVAAVAGLPVGMGAYLLANRMLPAGLAGRAEMEVAAMFWAWGGVALIQFAWAPARAWVRLFQLGAIVFALSPIVSALATDRGLIASIARGDGFFAGFDAGLLAIAGLLSAAAWLTGAPGRSAPAEPRGTEPAHA